VKAGGRARISSFNARDGHASARCQAFSVTSSTLNRATSVRPAALIERKIANTCCEDGAVLVEVRRTIRSEGHKPHRPRHGSADRTAEDTRLIAGGRDDAAPVGVAADRDGSPRSEGLSRCSTDA